MLLDMPQKYRMLFTLVILEGGEVPLAPMWYRIRL